MIVSMHFECNIDPRGSFWSAMCISWRNGWHAQNARTTPTTVSLRHQPIQHAIQPPTSKSWLQYQPPHILYAEIHIVLPSLALLHLPQWRQIQWVSCIIPIASISDGAPMEINEVLITVLFQHSKRQSRRPNLAWSVTKLCGSSRTDGADDRRPLQRRLQAKRLRYLGSGGGRYDSWL